MPLRWSSDHHQHIQVSEDGLACDMGKSASWCGLRATQGVLPGSSSLYYEVSPCAPVGSSLNEGDWLKGVIRAGFATAACEHLHLGTDAVSFGFGSSGVKSHSSSFIDYGEAWGPGDVLGVYLRCADANEKRAKIEYYLNGQSLGVAFEIRIELENELFYPAICGRKGAQVKTNFGQTPFLFTVPGYESGPSLQYADGDVALHLSSDIAVTANDGGGTNGHAVSPKHTKGKQSEQCWSGTDCSQTIVLSEDNLAVTMPASRGEEKLLSALTDPTAKHTHTGPRTVYCVCRITSPKPVGRRFPFHRLGRSSGCAGCEANRVRTFSSARARHTHTFCGLAPNLINEKSSTPALRDF